MAGLPYSKEQQTARGERRYRRKIASAKQWQAIAAAKQGPCRCTGALPPNELHHVVARVHGGGDVADNIVPLSTDAHARVTARDPVASRLLLKSLTDAEYAYMIETGCEDYPVRAYGLRFAR